MQRRCPKCGAWGPCTDDGFVCRQCSYSTDDFVVRRRNLATHRNPPTITQALPHRKVNGST